MKGTEGVGDIRICHRLVRMVVLGNDCQTPFCRARRTVAKSDVLWVRGAGRAHRGGSREAGRVMKMFFVKHRPWRGGTIEATRKEETILTPHPHPVGGAN